MERPKLYCGCHKAAPVLASMGGVGQCHDGFHVLVQQYAFGLQDRKNKLRLEGPPVLDEGQLNLEKKNLWPFTKIEPGGGEFHRGTE